MKIKKTLAVVAVLAFALIGHGCSDGELQLSSFANPSVSPFVSISADPAEVQSGGSTTLKWTVANAASVEISSDDGSFHAGPIDMSGKTEDQLQVDDIMATTTYTITAIAVLFDANVNPVPHDPYIPVKSGQIEFGGGVEDDGADPDLGAEAATVSDSATVTVVDSDLSISFYADDSDNMACMPRVLHWEVTPSDATIEISASTGEVVELSTTCAPETQPATETETDTETETETEDGEVDFEDIEQSQVQAPDGIWNFPDTKKSKTISISKSITTGMPATGCAVVYPCVPTTYTLTATDEDESMSEDLLIVPGNLIIDYDQSYITANGEHLAAFVNSFPAEDVPVAYQISPSMIPVTVVADKEVGCELPQNRVLAQMPETTDCDISEETTFKLMAHVGDDMIEVSRVKVMADAGSGRVDVTTAHAWAFEGEEVTVTVTPRTEGDAAKITKIRIKGMDVIEKIVTDATPIVERVTVPLLGVQVEVFNSNDEDPITQQAVYALPLISTSIIGKPITEAMFDPNDIDRSYFGTELNLMAEGVTSFLSSTLTVYRNGSLMPEGNGEGANGPIAVPFGLELTHWFNQDGNAGKYIPNSLMINGVRDFPVRAIAVREGTPNEMFVGTTGSVLYTLDAGMTWDVFVGPYMALSENGVDYDGQHETCAAETLHGGQPKKMGDFAYYAGVCDIVVDGTRMYVATDNGVATYTDADALIADPNAEGLIHFVPAGADGEARLATFKHVANDLELLEDGSSTKIFAAMATGTLNSGMTVNGVYVSNDQGESWTSFGSLGVDTYAVKVDMHDGEATKIYAAAADGIYVSDVDSANWEKVHSGAAYALADDPYTTGTLMAGLDDGAVITRDAGDQWGPLTVGGINSSGKVTAIAMAAKVEGSYVSYRAAFASEGGFLSGKVMVPTTTTSSDAGWMATVEMQMMQINQ